MEVPEPKKVRRSCFFSHLADLPLIKSATLNAQEFYTEAKERSLLFRAWASMAELVLILAMWGADKTVGKWLQTILRHEGEAQLAAAIDTYACVKLQQLEGKFPVLTKSADVVVKKTTHQVLSVVFIIPRWILESRLGKIAMLGLDKTLQFSVCVADLLQSGVENDELQTAEINSATNETDTALPAPEPDVMALVTAVVRTTASCARGLFPTLYGWFVLAPLLVWVTLLNWTRTAVRFIRRRPRRPSRRRSHRLAARSDPETKAKISSRRRMSPRKRIPSLTEALAQYIPKKAASMLGLTTPPAEMKMPLFGSRLPEPDNEDLRTSPNMEEGGKRKRRAPDGDEEDFYNLVIDLENYRSDEDSDYELDDLSTTDSYEYICSGTEGDSEEEVPEKAREEPEVEVVEVEDDEDEEAEAGAKDSGVCSAVATPTGSESPESTSKQSLDAPRPADSADDVIKSSPADSSQPTATSGETIRQR